MHSLNRAKDATSAFAKLFVFVPALCLFAALAVPSSGADAAQGLRAKILLTQKGIPSKLGANGVLKFAKTHRAKRLYEVQDRPISDRYWHATMVARFDRPVGDLEFEILFYDTQGPRPKFVAPAMTVFVSDRTQKTIVHKMRLKRPQFSPNRRMELVVTVRRQEAARYAFQLLGSEVQRNGRVDFSEEEVR